MVRLPADPHRSGGGRGQGRVDRGAGEYRAAAVGGAVADGEPDQALLGDAVDGLNSPPMTTYASLPVTFQGPWFCPVNVPVSRSGNQLSSDGVGTPVKFG